MAHLPLSVWWRPCKKTHSQKGQCFVLFNIFNCLEMHCVRRLTHDGIEFHRQEGFLVGGARHGRRFGNGVYLAEDLQKSLSYCSSSDGINYVLLCRSCHQTKVPTCSHKNSDSHSLSSPRARCLCVPELGSLGELGTPCVTGIVVLDHLCCRLSPEHAFSFAAPDSGQRALIFTTRRRIGTLMPIHLPKQLVALQSWLTQERKGLESISFLMSRRCTLST